MRDVEHISLADVLLIYHTDRRDQFEDELQKRRFDASVGRLNEYFGKYNLGEMSQTLTAGYVKDRGSPGGARRDLENLRAAINHHARQNLHRAVITVTLPPKGQARDRWLERNEAARLLWAAWRHREEQTIHRGKNKGIKNQDRQVHTSPPRPLHPDRAVYWNPGRRHRSSLTEARGRSCIRRSGAASTTACPRKTRHKQTAATAPLPTDSWPTCADGWTRRSSRRASWNGMAGRSSR